MLSSGSHTDYGCALQKDILVHGRIYVSEHHLSFHSNILGWITDVSLLSTVNDMLVGPVLTRCFRRIAGHRLCGHHRDRKEDDCLRHSKRYIDHDSSGQSEHK